MKKIEFFISDNDLDRLFAIKEIQGHDALTGNEFAERILVHELHKLFPATPEYDDDGRLINADKYRGQKG